MTNTQRTLAYLKKQGWIVGMVERWLPRANVRQDLFNLIDIIAIKPGVIWGVQSTGQAVSEHVQKALVEPRLKEWLLATGEFSIIGWTKKGPRGKRKVWTPRQLSAFIHRDSTICFEE